MKNFNIHRFLSFGKYDIAINTPFYRSLALMCIFVCTGIAMIGFAIRYYMFKESGHSLEEVIQWPEHLKNHVWSVYPGEHHWTLGLLAVITVVFSTALIGYTFHNLRNKQGRISELTIPATNLERWSWHVLFMMIGGQLVCFCSVVCADITNAILNLITYGTEISDCFTKELYNFNIGIDSELTPEYQWVIILGYIFIPLMVYSTFTLGNAIKYKYNIILTIIATQAINFVLLVGIISLAVNAHPKLHMDSLDLMLWFNTGFEAFIFITSVIAAIISVVFYTWSYKFYCKAQITSRLNK